MTPAARSVRWLAGLSAACVALALSGDRPSPDDVVVLHAWISLSRTEAEIANPNPNPSPSPNGSTYANAYAFELSMEHAARRARAGAPLQFVADAARPSTFQGSIQVRSDTSIVSKDTSYDNHASLGGRWPAGTVSADRATAQATFTKIDMAGLGHGVEATIAFDLPVEGSIVHVEKRDGHDVSDPFPVLLPYETCRPEGLQRARCRFQLDLLPPPPEYDEPVPAVHDWDYSAIAQDMQGWMMDVANQPVPPNPLEGSVSTLQTRWLPSGHFIARSDGHYTIRREGNVALSRVLHVVLWSSAPDDHRLPPGLADIASTQ